MNNIIFKVLFKKGSKGSKGDTGVNFAVPEGAIVLYDGSDTPEGYEDTTAPEGFSIGSEIKEFQIEEKITSNTTETITGGISE